RTDTAPSELSPLPLHDALPIYALPRAGQPRLHRPALPARRGAGAPGPGAGHRVRPGRPTATPLPGRARPGWRLRPPPVPVLGRLDRKSTRLNSSHVKISYAVVC